MCGYSQIKQYQIKKVLEGIYETYKNRNYSRNFLISPESFTYIFGGNDASCISQLKTCLLMLEKDFYDKYNYKVLVTRPQSVFTKAYVVVQREHEKDVLNSIFGKCFKFIQKGRYQELQKDGTLLSDTGDVYAVDLKSIWEEFHPNISFPQFKYWYFNKQSAAQNNVEIMPGMLFHSIHNYDALIEAVERRRFLVFYGLDEQEFISYYTDCPLNIRAKHPKAVMTFARQMFSLGNYEMGKNTCAEFETIIGNYQGQDKNNLLGTYQLLLSYAEYNNLDAMIEHLQMAKTYMQDSKSAFLRPETELNESYSLVFMFHSKSGELDNEIQAYTKYVSLFSEVVNDNLNGTVELIMAEKEYLQGNMLDAEILLNKAVMKIQRSSQWNRKLCT